MDNEQQEAWLSGLRANGFDASKCNAAFFRDRLATQSVIHPQFILECIGRHVNAEGSSLLQVALNTKGTAAARKKDRMKFYEELQKVGLPRYNKDHVKFIEGDASSINLKLALLHV